MSASVDEGREELRALRPDVLRIAAGLAAGLAAKMPMFDDGYLFTPSHGWGIWAESVAAGALAVVQAVDRVTGGDE